MGRSVIEYVVQLLNDGGIRAAAALPPGNLIRVTEPVAAVSLGVVLAGVIMGVLSLLGVSAFGVIGG